MGIFDMRMIAGEVDMETFKLFEDKRKELRDRNIKYKYYFKSKYSTVRILVEVFANLNPDFLKLVDKLEEAKV